MCATFSEALHDVSKQIQVFFLFFFFFSFFFFFFFEPPQMLQSSWSCQGLSTLVMSLISTKIQCHSAFQYLKPPKHFILCNSSRIMNRNYKDHICQPLYLPRSREIIHLVAPICPIFGFMSARRGIQSATQTVTQTRI